MNAPKTMRELYALMKPCRMATKASNESPGQCFEVALTIMLNCQSPELKMVIGVIDRKIGSTERIVHAWVEHTSMNDIYTQLKTGVVKMSKEDFLKQRPTSYKEYSILDVLVYEDEVVRTKKWLSEKDYKNILSKENL